MFGSDKPNKPSARGFTVVGQLKFIKNKYPRDWSKILQAMPPESEQYLRALVPAKYVGNFREFFKTVDDALRTFTIVAWYPIEINSGFDIAIRNVIATDLDRLAMEFSNEPRNILRYVGKEVAKGDLGGALGYILSWGATEKILASGMKIWDKYYSHGTVEILEIGKGVAKAKIKDVPYFFSGKEDVFRGFIEGMLESFRESNINVKCDFVNRQHFDIEARWGIK
jgi:hypothetical protein